MTMKWSSRDYRFDPSDGNGRGSFQEHNKCVRGFRKSHADVAMVNGQRLDEVGFLESLRHLPVRRTVIETGRSRLANGTMDWSALVPIFKVARYKLSQN